MNILDQQHARMDCGASLDERRQRAKLAAMARRIVHCFVQASRALRDHHQIGDERLFFAVDALRCKGFVHRAPARDRVFVGRNA